MVPRQTLLFVLVEAVGLELAVGGKTVSAIGAAIRFFAGVDSLKFENEYRRP